jgi:putative ABC transport system substrate-binding protein
MPFRRNVGYCVRRREFISLLGGAVALAPPAAAFAQSDRTRVVGLLLSQPEGDQEAKDRIAALREGLQKLGWIEGRNMRIEARYAGGSAERMRTHAAELVRLRPDLLFAAASSALGAFKAATATIPIVFAQVTDPVGAGLVPSLARPGGHITGFTQHEFSIGIKWVELLKELAPRTEHVAAIYDPQNPSNTGYLSVIAGSAQPFRVQLSEHPVRNAAEIERAIGAIAGKPNSGLVVLPGPAPSVHRELVVALAHTHRLPAVYAFRYWVKAGGLAFYGVDNIELYRQAAAYVDRILKGEKPGDLPIQHASKFELVINLKTAKALGINPSNALLARTDEVIE